MKTLALFLTFLLFGAISKKEEGYLVVVEHNSRVIIHEKLKTERQADSILNCFFTIPLDSVMGEHHCIIQNDTIQFYCEKKKLRFK